MKVSERLALIDKIGRELQSRFTFSELDDYLTASGIVHPQNVAANSKWVYSRAALTPLSPAKILEVADDLGIGARCSYCTVGSLCPGHRINPNRARL